MSPMVLALLFSTANSERAILPLDDPMLGLRRSFRTVRGEAVGEEDKAERSRSNFLVDWGGTEVFSGTESGVTARMVEAEEVPISGVTVLSVEVDFCEERSSVRYSSYRLGCLRRLSCVQRSRSMFETTVYQFLAHPRSIDSRIWVFPSINAPGGTIRVKRGSVCRLTANRF